MTSYFKINNLAIGVRIFVVIMLMAADIMKLSLHLHLKLGGNNKDYHCYNI